MLGVLDSKPNHGFTSRKVLAHMGSSNGLHQQTPHTHQTGPFTDSQRHKQRHTHSQIHTHSYKRVLKRAIHPNTQSHPYTLTHTDTETHTKTNKQTQTHHFEVVKKSLKKSLPLILKLRRSHVPHSLIKNPLLLQFAIQLIFVRNSLFTPLSLWLLHKGGEDKNTRIFSFNKIPYFNHIKGQN